MLATAATAKRSMHSRLPVPVRSAPLSEGRFPRPVGGSMRFARNTEVYGEDDPAEYLYQVISGAVRTYRLLDDGRRHLAHGHQDLAALAAARRRDRIHAVPDRGHESPGVHQRDADVAGTPGHGRPGDGIPRLIGDRCDQLVRGIQRSEVEGGRTHPHAPHRRRRLGRGVLAAAPSHAQRAQSDQGGAGVTSNVYAHVHHPDEGL